MPWSFLEYAPAILWERLRVRSVAARWYGSEFQGREGSATTPRALNQVRDAIIACARFKHFGSSKTSYERHFVFYTMCGIQRDEKFMSHPLQQHNARLQGKPTSMCHGKHVGKYFGDRFSCDHCRYVCAVPKCMRGGDILRVNSQMANKRIFRNDKFTVYSRTVNHGGEYFLMWRTMLN